MNELATNTGYPANQFPNTPLDSASDFFQAVAQQYKLHLAIQRNLTANQDEVRRRFIARHTSNSLSRSIALGTLALSRFFATTYNLRTCSLTQIPFASLLCSILSSQTSCQLSSCMIRRGGLLRGPNMWLEYYGTGEFLERYVPRMEQFLRALQRVEARSASPENRG